MKGLHISFFGVRYSCPHCEKGYTDESCMMHDRIARNKQGYATRTCSGCLSRFGVASDITGDLIGFKLGKDSRNVDLP